MHVGTGTLILGILNTIEDHIFKYLRYFVPLNEDPVTT